MPYTHLLVRLTHQLCMEVERSSLLIFLCATPATYQVAVESISRCAHRRISYFTGSRQALPWVRSPSQSSRCALHPALLRMRTVHSQGTITPHERWATSTHRGKTQGHKCGLLLWYPHLHANFQVKCKQADMYAKHTLQIVHMTQN